MDTKEEWRWIPDCESRYEVSDHGRVRTWTGKKKGRQLKLVAARNGYWKVGLWRGGMVRQVEVHSLVALAFHGPRPTGHQVRHLDGTRTNNHLSNLAYGTPAENQADTFLHGTDRASRVNACDKGHPLTEENIYRRPGSPSQRICRACMKVREEKRAAKPRTVGALLTDPEDPRHGTSSGYGYRRCRCEKCVAWNSAYCAASKAKRGAA